MSRRVCWGNPKGLSQRSHLFRRPAGAPRFEKAAWKDQRASPEGAAGPCWSAAPWLNSPEACEAVTSGWGCNVYSEGTLNPAQPPRLLCFPSASRSDSPCAATPSRAADNDCSAHRLHRFCVNVADVTLNPDASAGRISALSCLHVLPSQRHGYQSDCAKVGPPHKFTNL